MTQSCPPQPQVSVIVPVYNQERYLEECISSIRRQTLAEWEILYSIIRDFLTAHCTAAECRRASLHLPFRLLLQSSGFSDFGRRLRRAGKNTGIRRKLLHFCPVPSWRRNGRAQLRQVREQLEEIRRNITF